MSSSAPNSSNDYMKTGSYHHSSLDSLPQFTAAIAPLGDRDSQEENMQHFENVLQAVAQSGKSGGYLRTISSQPPLDENDLKEKEQIQHMLRQANQDIHKEEMEFAKSAEVGDCDHTLLSLNSGVNLSRSAIRGLDLRRTGIQRNLGPSAKQQPPLARDVQGSAGSSKASSNASDESEESDLLAYGGSSGLDHAKAFKFTPESTPQSLSGSNCLDYLEHGFVDRDHDLTLHGKSGNMRSSFDSYRDNSGSPTEGIIQESNNCRKIAKQHISSYGPRRNTAPLRTELSDSPNGAFMHAITLPDPSSIDALHFGKGRGSGSYSDPSSYGTENTPNDKYHYKKQGRKQKLEKLTKFQSKKHDHNNQADNTALKDWDMALKKGATKGGDEFLDIFATELSHQKSIVPKNTFNQKTSQPEERENSITGQNRTPPCKSYHGKDSNPKDDFRLKGDPVKQSTLLPDTVPNRSRIAHESGRPRKAKLSDSEHDSSDHELPVSMQRSYGTIPSRTNQSGSDRLPFFTIADKFLNHGYDRSSDGPSQEGMTWEKEVEEMEVDPSPLPAENDHHGGSIYRTSSGSSESSVDRVGLKKVGQYVRLNEDTQGDADVDDAEKPENPVTTAVKATKKRNKKKSKKKPSASFTAVSPQKPEEPPVDHTSSGSHNERTVPEKTIAQSDITPPKPPTKDVPTRSELDSPVDPPSDSEFQVVTRRLAANKTSPAKSYANQHYSSSTRYQINRSNRHGYPSARTVKQPVAVVVPAPPEYTVLRRRNSAGDLTKGITEGAPDGHETGGDVSDMDSVRSMPISKRGKAGGKTTSAPATRLPTPGISYADIAKGAHSGGAVYHTVPDTSTHAVASVDRRPVSESVKRTDSSKSESEKDAYSSHVVSGLSTSPFRDPVPLVKSVSADRVAVNPKAEGAPHQRLTPNQIISKGVDKQNRKNGASPAGNAGPAVQTSVNPETHGKSLALGKDSDVISVSAAHGPQSYLANPRDAAATAEPIKCDETSTNNRLYVASSHGPPIPPSDVAIISRHLADYRSAHDYSDRGESTNPHTNDLYRSIGRLEHPCPPLAPRLGPVIYTNGPVMLPSIRETESFGRSTYGRLQAETAKRNGMTVTGSELPSKIVGLDERKENPPAMAESRTDSILQNDSEVMTYLEESVNDVVQKALKGVPGYRIFKL